MERHRGSHYNIGDIIDSYGRTLEIIDLEIQRKEYPRKDGSIRKSYKRRCKYKCLKCGLEHWAMEYNIHFENRGCKHCDVPQQNSLVVGVNDIATVAPDIVKLLKDKNNAVKYCATSGERIDFICPDCGQEHRKRIATVVKSGLPCQCSDGVSYPNKFMYSLWRQIGVFFRTEISFDWSMSRRYDGYIEFNGYKIIVEQHGEQHYSKPIMAKGKCRSIEEEHRNDILKRQLALDNGIDLYFEIDCRKSNVDYIRKSVIDTGILEIIGVNADSIDWKACDEFATSNLIKEICEFREQSKWPIIKIAEKYGFSRKTIREYLAHGAKFGWCSYSASSPKENTDATMFRRKSRPIHCSETGIYYDSSGVAAEEITRLGKRMIPRNIRYSAANLKPYNGYHFDFISQAEFNRIKTESPNFCVGDYFVLPQGDNNG